MLHVSPRQSLVMLSRPLQPVAKPADVIDATDAIDRFIFRSNAYDACCAGQGVQFSGDAMLGPAQAELVKLHEGVLLVSVRQRPLQSAALWMRHGDQLSFSILLGDGCRIGADEASEAIEVPSRCSLITQVSGPLNAYHQLSAGDDFEAVTIIFKDPEALARYGLDLATPLDRMVADRLGSASVLISAPDRSAFSTARDIRNCRYDGNLRLMYLQAKARELICHLLAATPITEREGHSIAHRARALLTSAEEKMPIDDLARRIGVSTGHLSRAFRAAFGETIQDFAIHLRLAEAHRLLTATDLPLIQIALASGYEHHASFSIAFKRVYGVAPSEVRRSERTHGAAALG